MVEISIIGWPLDSLKISPKDASVSFSMITAKDGWLETYDKIHFRCEVVFKKMDSQWIFQRKRISLP